MSRYRAIALRASLAAIMAATMGAMTLTPGTASAAPVKPAPTTEAVKYPPEPPKLTVNKGSVKTGKYVQASGKRYLKNERVTIIVRFKPKGSSTYRTVNEKIIRADKKGKFSLSLRLAKVGTVTVRGRGRTSGLSSMATIKVTSGKNNGSFTIRLASFTPGSEEGTSALTVAKPAAAESTTSTGSLALAGFGAMALIGSAVATQRVVRRRRRANVAA